MTQNSLGGKQDLGLNHPLVPYAAPLAVTSLGAWGLLNNPLAIDLYGLLLTPPLADWILLGLGVLSMVSVWMHGERKQRQLEGQVGEVKKQEKKLRRKEAELDRKRRRMYRLDDFNDQYKGEPKRGQTKDGYIVYAGKARSDDVYAVTKTDEGELVEAGERRVNQIENDLMDKSVDWLAKVDTSTTVSK
jgi:heme exporter protein D